MGDIVQKATVNVVIHLQSPTPQLRHPLKRVDAKLYHPMPVSSEWINGVLRTVGWDTAQKATAGVVMLKQQLRHPLKMLGAMLYHPIPISPEWTNGVWTTAYWGTVHQLTVFVLNLFNIPIFMEYAFGG